MKFEDNFVSFTIGTAYPSPAIKDIKKVQCDVIDSIINYGSKTLLVHKTHNWPSEA